MQLFLPKTTKFFFRLNNIIRLILFISFLLLFFVSCKSSKFGLNKDEQNLVSASSNKNITYKIYHDKNAIRSNKKNGVYFMKLTGYGLCSRDSNYIKKGAIALAERVIKIMNFKNSYEYIDVEYENISYGGPNNALDEQPVCINIVRLPIANLSLAYLRERINTHDNNSGPGSYRNLRH
jgi:hypothetical protein